jgi:serine/threonine protein kinase
MCVVSAPATERSRSPDPRTEESWPPAVAGRGWSWPHWPIGGAVRISEDVARRLDPMVGAAEYVAEGGQKTVFRFSHASADWALKMIDLGDTERRLGEAVTTVVARVEREVRILHEIESPHLPKLGPWGPRLAPIDAHLYFTYSEEYIEGRSLRDLMAAGRLSAQVVAAAAHDIGLALEDLWAKRIVHRDVKPENIVQRASNRAFVLLDPGYALDLADTSLTGTGGVVGTAPYYSPEQLDAGNKRALDCRSDLYSLGVSLYEAATGSHPYCWRGMTREQLASAIRTAVPADLRSAGCPDHLAGIVARLLRKRRHLRFRSPTDFLESLKADGRGTP